ncbi:MAG: metallophosphoesterase family protein [Coriobacteriia bacterium]|nr:metallophosphoesterase family protein [Coriobacteriia bacterium]
MLVGVISDTHGSLPATIVAAFQGVDRIVHAGDVGGQGILDELEAIAPVTAVRGNMDTGELEWRLADTAVVRLAGRRVMVVHKKEDLLAGGLPEGIDVVVSGHTHRSCVECVGNVLYVNPGAAGGKARDGRGPTAALLDLATDPPTAQIVDL